MRLVEKSFGDDSHPREVRSETLIKARNAKVVSKQGADHIGRTYGSTADRLQTIGEGLFIILGRWL